MPTYANNSNMPSINTRDILIGAAIGAILVWILFGKQQQQTVSPMQIISPQQLYLMQNRIQELEYQLQQYSQLKLYPGYITNNTNSNMLSSEQQQHTAYRNNEKWAITRNKEGFISNIEVVRDAKVS